MKQTLFLATTRNENGETETRLYAANRDFFRDTFSPSIEILSVLPLCIHGKTYSERKASAEQAAVDLSYADCGGLSWLEYATISAFFEKVGKRYGLLREFRENAIC